MKKLVLLGALALAPILAHGQGYANYPAVVNVSSFSANCIPFAATAITLQCGGLTDNGTNVISTEAFLAADGTINLPAYAFSNNSNMGMYRAGSSDLRFTVGAVDALRLTGGNAIYPASGLIEFGSSLVSSADLFFGRRTTANLRFGAADVNGVPVAQTISVQNAITGSNLVGSQFSLAGSLGTGTGLPAPVVIQGADASVATGTTAQTEISRFVNADTKNLTTGAATTLLSIPLATLQTTGGLVFIHMEATDGTNQCTLDDLVTYSAENSAGVFVNQTSKMGTGSTACTAAKSLTATYAVTSATPALLQVTPTLTGITATRFTAVYTVMHGGMTNPTL